MDDVNEILWRMYEEHCVHARHHETLRATTSNIIIVVAGGILAILAHQGTRPTLPQLPLTLFLVVLGLIGALFTAKYHERFDLHMERARSYRGAIAQNLPLAQITELKNAADQLTKTKHPVLFDLRLYRFWVTLHILVALLGALFTAEILLDHLAC